MDFKSKGIAWVGNIWQKFETLCLEVDDILCQEPCKYLENQLPSASTNVKQFCSEFVQDVLPPVLLDSLKEEAPNLSLEQNKCTDLAVCERSNIVVDVDHKNGLFDVNSVEKKFPSEIPVEAASAEEDSSLASLFCGVNQCNDEGGSHESCDFKLPDNALSAVSSDTSVVANLTVSMNESSWSGFELCEEFKASEDFVSLTHSGRTNETSAEEVRDDPIVTQPGMETTKPFNIPKLDESCILVDINEIVCVSNLGVKFRSYQENTGKTFVSKIKFAEKRECEQQATTCSEDLDAELNQSGRDSFTLSLSTGESDSTDHGFCEHEWEII